MGVIRMDSSTLSFAFVMAAMIFVMSKVTSEPFRLITFICLSSINTILSRDAAAPQHFRGYYIITHNIWGFKRVWEICRILRKE